MDITTILFLVFAAMLLAAALGVITARNPVHAVLLLVPLGAVHAADSSKLPTKPNILFLITDQHTRWGAQLCRQPLPEDPEP
jgi:hypothetical protein